MDTVQRGELGKKVYTLHLNFVRRLNDAVVFLTEAAPLLEDAQMTLSDDLRRYDVPSVDGVTTSKRTLQELQEIYERFLSRQFFESFLLTAVSGFESYLFEVLRLVITEEPRKLLSRIDGDNADKQVSLEAVVLAPSKEQFIEEFIKRRLLAISYMSPGDYLRYVKMLAGIDTSKTVFVQYTEVKATRDIVVHNGGYANEQYRKKAGVLKRANDGELLKVDKGYFRHAVRTLKGCSLIITRDIDKAYPP